jgi:hypothetical protein
LRRTYAQGGKVMRNGLRWFVCISAIIIGTDNLNIGLFSVPAPPFRFAASGGVFFIIAGKNHAGKIRILKGKLVTTRNAIMPLPTFFYAGWALAVEDAAPIERRALVGCRKVVPDKSDPHTVMQLGSV